MLETARRAGRFRRRPEARSIERVRSCGSMAIDRRVARGRTRCGALSKYACSARGARWCTHRTRGFPRVQWAAGTWGPGDPWRLATCRSPLASHSADLQVLDPTLAAVLVQCPSENWGIHRVDLRAESSAHVPRSQRVRKSVV